MALSSSSRSDPWDHFLHSRSIPGVPGTPWSGGSGRQVQGWQAATARGSARRQFGPLLPCPTDGSPEAGSRPPRELLLHSFRRSQGEPAPLFLRALPVFSLSAHLRSWCLRSLGPSPLRPLRPREAGALGGPRPLLYCEHLLCIQLQTRESPGDSREARCPDSESEGSAVASYPWTLCGPRIVHSTPAPP